MTTGTTGATTSATTGATTGATTAVLTGAKTGASATGAYIESLSSEEDDANLVIAIALPILLVAVIAVLIIAALLILRRNRNSEEVHELQPAEGYLEDIEIKDTLGEGNFGQVYSGVWYPSTLFVIY